MKKWLRMMLVGTMTLSIVACSSGSSGGGTTASGTSADAGTQETAAVADTGSSETQGAGETADASGDPAVTLSFGSTSAAEDYITQAMNRVAETVAERSGGSITINVYPASQLGDAVAQLESVGSGGQDMFVEAHASYMQQFGVTDAGAVSFGVANTQEKLTKLVNSDLWMEWEQQFLDQNNIHTISHNWIRQPGVIISKKPLRAVDDFSGVKIRTVSSETTIAVYNSLGFNSTPIAFSETYLSLQQGVVDATFGTRDNVYTMGFYEQAPYLLDWGPSCTSVAVWINNDKWNSMTPAQQQILKEACDEAGDWYTQSVNDEVAGYFTKMEEAGVEIINLTAEEAAEAESRLVELGRSYEGTMFSEGLFDRILSELE